MAHLRLGEILIKQGLITEEHLKKAIDTQKKEKGRLGEILVKLGLITEEDIIAALASQLALPYAHKPELLDPRKDQELEKIVPEEFAKKNIVLPISKNMNSLTCAICDPLDLLMLDNLKRISGCEINPVLATRSQIIKIINKFYSEGAYDGKASMLDLAVQNTYTDDRDDVITHRLDVNTSAELSLDKLIAKAGEAPVIKLVDLIIRQAIDERASDIHIEPFKDKINLRYRIDGILYQIPPPAPHLHLAIVSRIKIISKLDIAEKRLPQDGAIMAKLEDRMVDIRISTIPTVWGEKVVMRILDKEAVPLEITGLGFDSQQVDDMRKSLTSPFGLFFVTGPTGSGKSTTLYAALRETIDPKKNILTVEDPVEFKLDGINQVNIRPEIGLTFSTALKAFLRQDPDVIMVGEVRDLETAAICVRAALTGHFVLSTLHTNDAASAVTRLLDIGVEPYLLTPSLVMVLAQRLARRLCSKCKEAYEPNPEQHGGIKFKSDLIYRAKGCEDCSQTGFKGRVVVAEVMIINDVIRELISEKSSYTAIQDAARQNGMSSLFDSGIKKIEEGITGFNEIVNVTIA